MEPQIYGSLLKMKIAAGDKRKGVSGQRKGEWRERMKIDLSGGWEEPGQKRRGGQRVRRGENEGACWII